MSKPSIVDTINGLLIALQQCEALGEQIRVRRSFWDGAKIRDTARAAQDEVKAALDLCDDEGCPHHGTPHVCVNPKTGVWRA